MDSKGSKHFKDISSYDNIPKYNMERWHTNLKLIYEKGMQKSYNLNINNGIF